MVPHSFTSDGDINKPSARLLKRLMQPCHFLLGLEVQIESFSTHMTILLVTELWLSCNVIPEMVISDSYGHIVNSKPVYFTQADGI